MISHHFLLLNQFNPPIFAAEVTIPQSYFLEGAEAEPEQGLQLAAPDAAVTSAGPSGVVEA